MPLAEGDKAPDFSMPTDGGGTVSLAGLKGGQIVLYFYPKDDTPGCTKEACAFRDALLDFSAVDARIVGVSKDSVAKHDRFKAKYDLPFTLASDLGRERVRGLRRLGEEEAVWARIYGHRARNLPDRRRRQG